VIKMVVSSISDIVIGEKLNHQMPLPFSNPSTRCFNLNRE
jgi:hypothetical protein